MKPPTTRSEDAIAILRIELEGIEPLIWRRVGVRVSGNLQDLHRLIQAALGWIDCHLWQFRAGDRNYSMIIPDDLDWNSRITDAQTIQLHALLDAGVTQIGYIYDFGDNWEHRILVERIKAGEAGAVYPQYLGGERRCPPEDCGGIPGYYDFLDSIARK